MDARRRRPSFGLDVGAERNITDLRFADDVVHVARSKHDIRLMLTHFARAAKRYGLSLHFGKTKIMTWDSLAGGCKPVDICRGVAILGETLLQELL